MPVRSRSLPERMHLMLAWQRKSTRSSCWKDDQFYVVSETDNQQEQIYPEAKDLFFRIGDYGPQTFKFRRNGDGQVTDVTIKVFGRTYQGAKQN